MSDDLTIRRMQATEIEFAAQCAADEGWASMVDFMFDVIAFDADDTLWHNETLYARAQDRFKGLLLAHLQGAGLEAAGWIEHKLYQIESRNLHQYGYGIKGFALSMIETAIELTGGRITGQDVQRIIDIARDMLNADVELLEQVKPTLARLAASHALMLITKGDLLDQKRKLARSGIASHFRYIEIVSDKTPEVYRAILDKYQIEPARFLMVGNSWKSDVLPVITLGGQAVFIPYPLTWAHEIAAGMESAQPGYYQVEHLGLVPALVEQISSGDPPKRANPRPGRQANA